MSGARRLIVVPALHPAHDVIVRVDDIAPGVSQRVASDAAFAGVGGKAVNVALAIASMGLPVRLVACGDEALLAGLRRHGTRLPELELLAFPSPVPTRTDIALVDRSGRLSVINTTGPDPGAGLVAQVSAAALDGVGAGDIVVLAGSTPDGTAEAHVRIARAAMSRGAHVIVDASGDALSSLVDTRPAAVKISADEAAVVVANGGGVPESRRPPALDAVPIVGITDGGSGLRAWLEDGRVVRVLPPPDLQVMATLGAGDAVTAGLAIALAKGDDPLEGFVLGTAMAASTLDHLDPSVVPGAVDQLRSGVRVIPLDASS
jgi:fructose-1-phosphate kinase PfkB-like protein